MTNNLTILRRTAAQVLAAAALEQFPGASLVGGFGSHLGFHYDFTFPFAFHKDFLPLLEERMRAVIKKNYKIEIKEMVPKNAALFFEHRKQFHVADKALDLEEVLASIFQMGDFFDLAEPSFLRHSGEVASFKLVEAKTFGDGVTRIYGTAFFDKSALKEYLKKLKNYPEIDHIILGKEMDLFSSYKEGFWKWHPKGAFIRETLLNWWKKEHIKQSFQFPLVPAISTKEELLKAHLEFAPRAAETVYLKRSCSEDELMGMFSTKGETQDIVHIFCGAGDLVQESISSLQFITKISKILSFEWQAVLCVGRGRQNASWKKAKEALENALKYCELEYDCDDETFVDRGPRLELRFQDGLGRFWSGPYLEIACAHMCLVRSMFGSVERIVALLIEQGQGMLPLWLAPEQARVFTVSQNAEQFADECVTYLSALGLRIGVDRNLEQKLGSRLHGALIEKVPYCIFIGDREKNLKTVTVRAYGSTKDEQVSLDALAQKFK
ncbi:MAG: His/Gly/Thr/Pro-type tRNA ligase C-terminal domain-containing protein [Chlamydiota bacterium]